MEIVQDNPSFMLTLKTLATAMRKQEIKPIQELESL